MAYFLSQSFNGGELSELMRVRPDQQRYQSGCFLLKNMVCMAQGPATRRPGFVYCGETKDQDLQNPVRVESFVFASTESRVMEVGVGYIRFWRDDALIFRSGEKTNAWDATVSYSKGDYVQNWKGDTYRARQDHSVAQDQQPGQGSRWETYWTRIESTEWTDKTTSHEVVQPPPPYTGIANPVIEYTKYEKGEYVHRGGRVFLCIDAHEAIRENAPGTGEKWKEYWEKIPATTWRFTVQYALNTWVLGDDHQLYRCLVEHEAKSEKNKPGSGSDWEKFWTQSRRAEIATPYTAEDVPHLCFSQSADVVYVASRNHPPAKISRHADDDWTYEKIEFLPQTETPDNVTVANTEGMKTDGQKTYKYIVTALDAMTGEESLPSTSASVTCSILNSTDGNFNTISWSEIVPTPLEYRVYKYHAGVYGYIGSVSGKDGIQKFEDQNISADINDAPPDGDNPFKGENNYPGIVYFWQQRLGWASTYNQPFTVWLSPSAQFESLASATPPADDDAIEATLATENANAIMWVSADRVLVMGTSGNEWTIGNEGEALTPKTVGFSRQGSKGSAHVKPVSTGTSVLFVQRGGNVVREFIYNYENDRYDSPDASIISSHLLDGKQIRNWCFQLNPYSVVWATLDDGTFTGLTYVREHQVVGWHQHETAGNVESLCAVPGQGFDPVWAVITRTIDGKQKRFIERMGDYFVRQNDPQNAFFVDCGVQYQGQETAVLAGIAPHLAGETVKIWADGVEQREQRVAEDGTVVLEKAASHVSLGLGFISSLTPARPEVTAGDGTTLTRSYKVSQAQVRLYRSMGVWAGASESELEEIVTHDASDPFSPEMVTGDMEVVVDTGWDEEWTFLIQATGPVPMTVLGVVYETEVES